MNQIIRVLGLELGVGRKNDNSDIANDVNYGVASFLSWWKSVCNPETGITRIRGPEEYCLLSKVIGQAGWHLSPSRASPKDPHMAGRKYVVQRIPH